MNYIIYLTESETLASTFLIDGEKKRVEGFLKFWKLYRPMTLISILKIDDRVNQVIYEGVTKDAPLSF